MRSSTPSRCAAARGETKGCEQPRNRQVHAAASRVLAGRQPLEHRFERCGLARPSEIVSDDRGVRAATRLAIVGLRLGEDLGGFVVQGRSLFQEPSASRRSATFCRSEARALGSSVAGSSARSKNAMASSCAWRRPAASPAASLCCAERSSSPAAHQWYASASMVRCDSRQVLERHGDGAMELAASPHRELVVDRLRATVPETKCERPELLDDLEVASPA